MTEVLDYYEFLQISRNADPDTIHRVYRFLAARFHPDNSETGDADKFMRLQKAWEVLSDPQRRAEYDASFKDEPAQPAPLSKTLDFMDEIEGEMNRRLALLALLYIRRRTNPYNPETTLAEVEKQMGVPREYLQFTTWYLHNKKYITRSDSSELTLTVLGVDYVESNRGNTPVLDKLLTSGSGPASS
jgi:curved DNA-binding protein CbpA